MTIKKIINHIILLIALISGLNCNKNHSLKSKEEEFKTIYIDQFRLVYFREMLDKSYNISNVIREIIHNDHSGFTEPILTFDDYTLIDSLTKLDNLKMVIDSAKSNLRAEGSQGKRPLNFIIEKLRSKWLDSLAEERYKVSKVKDMYLH